MQTIKILFFYLILWLVINPFAHAIPKVIPKAPIIGATSYIMIDHYSGKVLAQKKATMRVPPASLTKIMTAYVVFHEITAGNIHLDDQVTISKKAWKTPGSRMFIEVNKKVSVQNLLRGMIIQSGNDASVALAEYVAGGEDAFAALMNQHARELDLKNTHFTNCTGLPHENHYTSAADLAILASALIRKFPQFYYLYSTKSFTYNKIKQFNRNKLLWWDKSVDGMKTGYTKKAGYCLVASAKREGMRLITVVLGTKSASARAQESQKLLNFGFRFFESHALYKAGKALKTLRIYKGSQNNLALGLKNDLYITLPKGKYKSIKPVIKTPEVIIAPIAKGQQVGTVEVLLDNKVLARQSVVALHDVPKGSLMRRAKDSILMWFK